MLLDDQGEPHGQGGCQKPCRLNLISEWSTEPEERHFRLGVERQQGIPSRMIGRECGDIGDVK